MHVFILASAEQERVLLRQKHTQLAAAEKERRIIAQRDAIIREDLAIAIAREHHRTQAAAIFFAEQARREVDHAVQVAQRALITQIRGNLMPKNINFS